MSVSVEVITLPYQHQSQSIDSSPLIELQNTREVIAQTSYMVGPPTSQSLVLVLTLRTPIKDQRRTPRHQISYVSSAHTNHKTVPTAQGQAEPSKRRAREAKLEAVLSALSEMERTAFEALRVWRNEEGIRCGVPAFEVCSNLNLVECVTRKPATLTALRAINGLGERRVKRFGAQLLEQLKILGLVAIIEENGNE
jgi:superfamily II DNA helicase RecQ